MNPHPGVSVPVSVEQSHPSFIVVDASLWVSRLVYKDDSHSLVKVWMERQRTAGMNYLSPALLLPEVAGAIARRTGDENLARSAIAALSHLPALRLIEMDRSLVLEAANLAADLGLRGADSLYVAVAVRLNLALATLDYDQKSRAEALVAVEYLR